MKAVLASRNEGKLTELGAILGPLGFDLESQAALDIPSPEETGSTFVENALIKAKAVSRVSGLAAFADDSGIVVPALGGAPGIHSARYAGEDATDTDNNAKLIEALDGIVERDAYYYCAMVYLAHADDPTPIIATARWHGAITHAPRGRHGFGYDPYFQIAGMSITSAELDPAEKNRISHRARATLKLVDETRACRHHGCFLTRACTFTSRGV